MKYATALLITLAGLVSTYVQGQGTFIYDQQSSTDEYTPSYGEGGPTMQDTPAPWGQSFTPSLSGVDFIRLKLDDANPLDGGGATVSINLRSDSINGTILGTTIPLTMANGFRGNPTFLFPTTVSVTPGAIYYFEPIVDAGSAPWSIVGSEYGYPGGSYIAGGSLVLQSDLWFREGLYVVPEPPSALLLAVGVAGLACWRRTRTMT